MTEGDPPEESGAAQSEEADDAPESHPDDHLEDLPDGSGCTEIWEHLAARRDREEAAADD